MTIAPPADLLERFQQNLAEVTAELSSRDFLLENLRTSQQRYLDGAILPMARDWFRRLQPARPQSYEQARHAAEQCAQAIIGALGARESLALVPEPETIPPYRLQSDSLLSGDEAIDAPHGLIERNLPLPREQRILLFRASQNWLEAQLEHELGPEIAGITYACVALPENTLSTVNQKTNPTVREQAAAIYRPTEDLIKTAIRTSNPSAEIDRILAEIDWNQSKWAKAVHLHPSTVTHLIQGRRLLDDNWQRLIRALAERTVTSRLKALAHDNGL